jgi:hypothetical protein
MDAGSFPAASNSQRNILSAEGRGMPSALWRCGVLACWLAFFCFVGPAANDTEDPAHSQRPTLNFTYRSSIEALGRHVVVLG